MSTILITGVHGTLGRPLRIELERRGHTVYGLGLTHSEDPMCLRADIVNYRELERALQGKPLDYVYHLAAEFGRINGEEFYETLWATNVIGTRNILELQRQFGFKLIFASSSEVYGDTPGILSEDMPMMPPQKNDYAISKWVGEIQCKNFIERYGSKILRLRFFNAYGPGEHYTPYRSVVCLFCYRALHDLPYEVYENYHRVFMYIDDFIPTLANCVDKDWDGLPPVINIGGAEYRSVKDLSDIVLSTLKKSDGLVRYLPEDKHNVVNKQPSIVLARNHLGHNPWHTLEDGIPLTLAWMRKVYGR